MINWFKKLWLEQEKPATPAPAHPIVMQDWIPDDVMGHALKALAENPGKAVMIPIPPAMMPLQPPKWRNVARAIIEIAKHQCGAHRIGAPIPCVTCFNTAFASLYILDQNEPINGLRFFHDVGQLLVALQEELAIDAAPRQIPNLAIEKTDGVPPKLVVLK
jgi:hypothetical protein